MSTSETESPKIPRFDLPNCSFPAYCGVWTCPKAMYKKNLCFAASAPLTKSTAEVVYSTRNFRL